MGFRYIENTQVIRSWTNFHKFSFIGLVVWYLRTDDHDSEVVTACVLLSN